MVMPLAAPMPSSAPAPHDVSSGASLVDVRGRTLPLQRTALRTRAKGGVARTVIRQTFVNVHDEPLEVTYRLPLPADGAVSAFRFELDGEVVEGEVDRRHRARERYDLAMAEGRTAALLDQERADTFTQRVGNVPPRSTVVAEIVVDQRLTWCDEGAWEWRFPTVVPPRYLGDAGRVTDAANVHVAISEAPLTHRLAMELCIDDALHGSRPASPSHALASSDEGFANDPAVWGYRSAALRRASGSTRVTLADREGVRLDRDVVVRWHVAAPSPGVSLDVVSAPPNGPDAGDRYALLTVVPPRETVRAEAVARDLIVLLDTSGSMGGAPLAQAARVVCAMLDTLDERDRIELVEFSSAPRRWREEPVRATAANRREAAAWVKALRASGSTEMRTALLEALRPLRAGAQRQVVLVTDGYIGFEREIVETVFAKLPTGCRLHTVGVGSAVNRALLTPAAQAGRGVEVVVAPDEDPEPAARRIVARTSAPLVTDLVIEGEGVCAVSPARAPDLYAASPALFALRLAPNARTVTVRGTSARGPWTQTLALPDSAPFDLGGAVRARFARDRVEDHELHLAAGGSSAELDAAIEELGLAYQVATRLTSWIAERRTVSVDRDAPKRRETQPQELVHGLSVEGLGLRAAVSVDAFANSTRAGGVRASSVTGAFAVYASAGPMPGAPPAPQSAPAPARAESALDVTARKRLAADPVVHSYVAPSVMAAPESAPLPAKRASRTLPWLLALVLLVLAAVAVWYVATRAAPHAPTTTNDAPVSPRR